MEIENQDEQKEYFIIFTDKDGDIDHISKFIPLKQPNEVKKRMMELHEKSGKISEVLNSLEEENHIKVVVEPTSRFFIVRNSK